MALKMFPRRANVPFSQETKMIHAVTSYHGEFRAHVGKCVPALTILLSCLVDEKKIQKSK